MKTILFALILLLTSFGASSQTATNFSCNDCNGVSHNFFSELDAGKVIILCWVMPCSTCIPASKTSYAVAQSFSATYPDRVKMYVCDDYANTSCSSLNSWCVANGLIDITQFSNTAINMADYGSAAMPKIVVVGNYTHHVYYNANVSVNSTLMSNAITTALQDYFVGIPDSKATEIKCFPNPAANQVSLNFNTEKSGSCKITLYNNNALQVSQSRSYNLKQGENTISLNTKELNDGIYYAHVKTDSGMMVTKFVVTH
jgi:hypothetical protein